MVVRIIGGGVSGKKNKLIEEKMRGKIDRIWRMGRR